MAEDIKTLIEKIQQEGVEAAQEKARQIESEARAQARRIVEIAKLDAHKIIQEAQDSANLTGEKQKALLSQAGRDTLLILRREINTILERLIVSDVRQALNPDALSKILSHLVMNTATGDKAEIIISLKKEDKDAIESGFLAKLKEETKKNVILRAADDIHAGFVISFDTGKSQFDFSDKALADYIGTFLKPKLKQILEG